MRFPSPARFSAIASLVTVAALHGVEPRLDSILPSAALSDLPVEIRDVDGDGRPDLTFPALGFHPAKSLWIKNLGQRQFAAAKDFGYHLFNGPAADGPDTLVDLDGDGHLDRFTFTASATGGYLPVEVHLDAGMKAGRREVLFPTSASWWMAADLDGDGIAELISLSPIPEGEGIAGSTLTILKRDLSGNYHVIGSMKTSLLVDSWPFSIRVLDVDGDGDLDFIVLGNSDSGLYERSADGTYIEHPLGTFPISHVADLNGDGIPDVSEEGGGTLIYQLVSHGQDGLEVSATQMPDIPFPDPELDWTLAKIESAPGQGSVLVWTGAPRGTDFDDGTRSIFRVRFGTWEVLSLTHVTEPVPGDQGKTVLLGLQDLDADGFPDAVFRHEISSNGQSQDRRLAVCWGKASGFDAPVWITPEPTNVTAAFPGDFDRDGDLDVVVSPGTDGVPQLLLNDGHGAFPVMTPVSGIIPAGGLPAGVTVAVSGSADMNSDQILDLVLTYTRSSDQHTAVAVALGHGDGTFTPPVLAADAFDTANSLGFIGQFIDWDHDGDLDLVGFGGWRENTGGGGLAPDWHFLLGGLVANDFLGNPVTIGTYTAGDLDGDGAVDLISGVYSAGSVAGPGELSTQMAIGFGDGQGGLQQTITLPISLGTVDFLWNPYVAGGCWIVDVDGDGLNDLLYREVTGRDFLGNPVTATRWKKNPGGHSRDVAGWAVHDLAFDAGNGLTYADFDGDGVKEWCSASGYLKPLSGGPFISPVYDFLQGASLTTGPGVSEGPPVLAVGDFDGDGDLDSLRAGPFTDLTLVRNLIVDETSGVSRHLRSLGVLGAASNPDADADGDGRSNAEELLTGSDPLTPDAAPTTSLSPRLDTAADGSLRVTFRSRADAADLGLQYIMESSNDLRTWSAFKVTQDSVTTGNSEWQDTTTPLHAGEGSQFFRMRYGTNAK